MAGSGLKIDVRSDIKQAVARLEANVDRVLPQATARALNRTATTVRAQASRRIRERYNLKAGAIRAQMRISRANRGRLTAEVIASGRPIPLIEFSARQTRKGVSVQVIRGRRKVRLHAFVAKMRTGHVGVFERTSSKRLPIRELFSVSLPSAFTQKEILTSIEQVAVERFRIELERELRFRTGAANG